MRPKRVEYTINIVPKYTRWTTLVYPLNPQTANRLRKSCSVFGEFHSRYDIRICLQIFNTPQSTFVVHHFICQLPVYHYTSWWRHTIVYGNMGNAQYFKPTFRMFKIAVNLVLQCNNFIFNGKHNRKINGTAMGTKMRTYISLTN